MKKSYTYKKKKQNRKIVIFPLMILIAIGMILGIFTLTKKETKAETTDEWICEHENLYIVNYQQYSNTGTKSYHMITFGCKDCDNKNVGKFLSYCEDSQVYQNNKLVCSICKKVLEESSSISNSTCLHPADKLEIYFEIESGLQCGRAKVKCKTCNKTIGSDFNQGLGHVYTVSDCQGKAKCIICSYMTKTTGKNSNKHLKNHKKDEYYDYNDSQHWHIEKCDACNTDISSTNEKHTWSAWKSADLSESDKTSYCSTSKERKCTVCGKKDYDVKYHDVVSANCKNPAKCKNCEYVVPLSSTIPNAHVDANNDGKCDLCGTTIKSGTSIEDPTTCSHPASKVKAATCTSKKYCTACQTYIGNALGHSWGAATCTKPKTCTRAGCGATQGNALGHTYNSKGEKYGFSSTNGGSGMHYKVCKVCGIKELVSCSKSVTAVEEKPTCVKKGKWKYTCNVCDAYWYAPIPAMGHSYDSKGKCTRTGCTATKDTTCTHGSYTDHYDYTDDNTCTKTRTCNKCGEITITTGSHIGGTHENKGECSNCHKIYQDHNRTDGIHKGWQVTENGHRQILNCYACDKTGGTGTYITDEMDHAGGTHANGGTCVACGEQYQEHDELVDYELVNSTQHRKITECSCGERTITNELSSHSYNKIATLRDNGDGTHSVRCKDCLSYAKTEAHTYSEGTCTTKPKCKCGAELDVTPSHIGGNHTNGGKCTKCATVYQNHGQTSKASYYLKTSSTHIPIYACTYANCTSTYKGVETAHTIATYTNNGDGTHSGTCTICQYTVSANHTFVNGECTVCKAKQSTTPEECQHIYAMQKDETGHWKKCTKCGVEESGSRANHKVTLWNNIENGKHSGKCTVCQYTVSANHTFVNGECTVCKAKQSTTPEECQHTYAMQKDETGHWKKCTKCGVEESGSRTAHSVTSWNDIGNGKHSGNCTVCQYTVSANHTFVNGECTVCKAKQSTTPEECNHNYVIQKDENSHWEKCTICQNETIKSAHNITKWTDMGDGKHKGICTECNYEVKKAHTYSNGKCSSCGAKEPTTTPENCTHNYEIKSDETGHWEKCTKCQKETVKSAHNITTWTDKKDGNHEGICTVCKKTITEAHTNGTSGKCTKCSYDGTSSGNNSGNGNNNNSNNGNNNNGGNNSNNGNNSGTNGKDNTTANGKIPQTGTTPIFITIATTTAGIAGFAVYKMKKLKDVK